MSMGRGLSFKDRVRFGAGLSLAAITIIAASVVTRADAAKPPVMNAHAKRGAVIFQKNCVSCHNKQPDDTTPFGPPNLHGIFGSKSQVHPPVTPAQAADFIRKGAAPMPAFGNILSPAEINDLIAYLKVQ